MSAANAAHFLNVYLAFEMKGKIGLLLPFCYHSKFRDDLRTAEGRPDF